VGRCGLGSRIGNALRGGVFLALILVAVVGIVPAVAAASPPSIESESVSHLTPTDATLEAEINLHEAGAGAYYQFQLVANPSEYASEILCPVKLPPTSDGCIGTQSASALPIGFLPGNTAQPGVTLPAVLDLASAGVTLKPATTYQYRVLVARRVQSEDTIEWEAPTVFGPDQTFTTLSAPVIETESVSHITSTDATIEAQINTGGRETTYEVWVGNYPECIEEQVEACASSGGGPAGTGAIVGTIPAGFSSHTVSVDIAEAWHKLSPNSSYIYSVSATNSAWAFAGSAYGGNKVFKTAAASPPAIESESVSHIMSTDATLEAQINTEDLETTYEFHLQEWPLCFDSNPPCERPEYEPVTLPGGKLLGSFIGQSVSADLNSAGVTLHPGEVYKYWVTATNAAGTTEGHTQRFIAPKESAQLLNTTAPSTTTNGGGQSAAPSTSTGSGGSTSPPDVTPLGSPLRKTATLKALTNTQKLSKALKACAKKPMGKRAACRKQAHQKYATAGKKSQK
jgi:hypothetical protein